MCIIETIALGHQYGRRRGIEDVHLRIDQGQIYGFLGPNGAGKTTAIRILLGFLKPSHGEARIFGKDCWSDSRTIKTEIGYVAGDVRLYPWLTIRRGLRLVQGLRNQCLRGHNLIKTGLELSERFSIDPDLPVRKMSRGNRQKVALILALVHSPQLIILDEPTSALDPVMQLTLMQILREAMARGCTILFSSHSLSEVESLCNHVLMIRQGKIVVDEGLNSLQARAPRIVHLTTPLDSELDLSDLPPGIQSIHKKESQVELVFDGSAKEIISWSARQPIADISISPPSLDKLFRQYYLTEEKVEQEKPAYTDC